MTDASSLTRVIQQTQPDELYNLAAQSHVAVSFEEPEYTADSDAVGTLRLLEAIRILGLEKKTRFYQASTSELFGLVRETPQKETTPFYPRSPYGVAKLYAYWITVNYREAYGMYACNGILFNHESPVRGETFVTRKITRALARIALGLQDCLYVGNLDARRDWGHARDFVEAQWRMLQRPRPEDFVIATGVQHSVREFIDAAARELGLKLAWSGKGAREVGRLERAPRRWSCAQGGPDRGAGGQALLPPRRGRHPARRRAQGEGQARLEAEDRLQGSGARDGAERPSRCAARRPGAAPRAPGVRRQGIGSEDADVTSETLFSHFGAVVALILPYALEVP